MGLEVETGERTGDGMGRAERTGDGFIGDEGMGRLSELTGERTGDGMGRV